MAQLPSYLSKLTNKAEAIIASNFKSIQNPLFSSGSISLDWALGGGLPENEMTILWGPPGCGKTTLALKILARLQHKYPDKFAIWIDTEYAFSEDRAKQLGVDTERLILIRTNIYEKAFSELAKISDDIIEDKNICFCGMDSVKGLASINEFKQMNEGKVDKAANGVGGIAKAINPALTILNRIANEALCTTVLIQHASMNMDTMTSKFYPYVLSGGQKLKHLASTTLFIDKPTAKTKQLTVKTAGGEEISYGSLTRFHVNKSRRTKEGRKVEVEWNLENGAFCDKEADLQRLATTLGVLWKEGSKKGLRFGSDPSLCIKSSSADGFADMMKKDPELYKKILEACREIRDNPVSTALIEEDNFVTD